MSWAWMTVFLWDVIFHKNWPALVMSKRSKEVDKGIGDVDSNFGKLAFIHEHLAEHLWVPVQRKHFSIKVPSTRSYITGETGKGGMAARGPTFKRALMDEAAYIERSESVFKGLRQACKNGTALNSTPAGQGNVFARIRFSKTTTFKKLSFHWSEHPRKSSGLYCLCGWKAKAGIGESPGEQFKKHATACPRLDLKPSREPEMRSPWYDREASDLTPEQIASELDISYERSRAGRVYTAYSSMRNVWQIMDRLGPRRSDENADDYRRRYLRFALDPRLPVMTSWDIGVGDATALGLWQEIDSKIPRVRLVDFIQDSDKSFDFYANIVNTVWKKEFAEIGGKHAFRHYGGQDVKNRDSKLESWFTNLKGEGIHVETAGKGELLEWVDFINDWYRRGYIELADWCTEFLDALQNYHYPTDDKGELIPGRHLPVHDEWSHSMDSKRYLFRNRYTAKLYNRHRRGVPTTRILARGGGYDRKTEHRIF